MAVLWESIKKTVLNAVWPVNSIYISFDHINPAAKFIGTWVRISDSFLYGISKDAEIGKTGGEAEHTLTLNEIPNINKLNFTGQSDTQGTDRIKLVANNGHDNPYTGNYSDLGEQPHNNMPPYIQVSIWRRIS